jgi:hypothetical protein
MKNKAVCIRCGTFKKDAFATCKQCDLTPKNDFEVARALILSEKTSYGNAQIGKTFEELENISKTIRNGRPYPIDSDEQTRVVREYYAYLKTIPPKKWYQHNKTRWIFFLCFLLAFVIAGYFLGFK